MVWGFLQGIKLANELLDENFEGHSVLSHVLNLHLQDRAVMKEENEVRILALQELVSKALTTANSANQTLQHAEFVGYVWCSDSKKVVENERVRVYRKNGD